MGTIGFTYDPLTIVRLAMDQYAESLEGKHTKAVQFARYEYLRTMTDGELEELLTRYVKEEKLEEITLADWKKDCQFIFSYLYETQRYKDLELKFNKGRQGRTGYGVIDKSDDTFYDCGFLQHWKTVTAIIKEKHPQYSEALDEMFVNPRLDEFNGITRKQLDTFIMEGFDLVGGSKPLEEYLD